jgi:hypothetical protein
VVEEQLSSSGKLGRADDDDEGVGLEYCTKYQFESS